jgi:hypothetical protein
MIRSICAVVLSLAVGVEIGCAQPQPEAQGASASAQATPAKRYAPPAEGIGLIQSVRAERTSAGVMIRGKLLLPETTRVWVELFPIKAVVQDEPLGHAELYLNPDGSFDAGPFKVDGSGEYRVLITSYFSRAWQQPEVLQAVGIKGTKLPKSTLKLDNPGTPGAGGHLEYSSTLTIGS